MQHYIYIVKCADSTLYTGYTNNIDARIAVHNSGKGAKYTRPRLPVTLLYSESFEDKSAAMKREYAIKQLSRAEKLRLIQNKL